MFFRKRCRFRYIGKRRGSCLSIPVSFGPGRVNNTSFSDQVAQGEQRVMPYHAGACVAHNPFHAFTHFRFIAMNAALGTDRFHLSVAAPCGPFPRIIHQRGAFITGSGCAPVMRPAVKADHFLDGFFLTSQ